MPGQVYSISSLGGVMSQPYLSQKLRSIAQPLFRWRQFVDAKEAIGKNRGDTFLFDKTENVATQGGVLVETNTIPETQFVTNQGTCVITEYGNSVPFTQKLENFHQFQIEPLTEQKLRDDMVKVLESACGAQYVATDFIAVCTATNSVIFTTNGTATASAASNLSAANTRAIVDFMTKKFIPKCDGRNYVAVCGVGALSGMHADSGTGGWVDISKYTVTFAPNIFAGEVGEFYKTRFVEETGYLSNAIGSSTAYGQAVFLAMTRSMRRWQFLKKSASKSPWTCRDMGLAWYSLLGFKTVWNYGVDTEQHIVFVTSA